MIPGFDARTWHCGPLSLHRTSIPAITDVFGVKAPPYRTYTAMLQLSARISIQLLVVVFAEP